MKKFFRHLISSRYANLLFRGAVLLLLLGILYVEFRSKDKLSEIWQSFLGQLQGARLLWLLGAVLLLPFNWLAETRKWHQFVRRYESMSLWKAVQAVLAGLSVSLFTPNRVGEYGGRILFVQPGNRWKAVIANLVGNFSQYLVLMTAGTAGTLFLIHKFWKPQNFYLQAFGLVAVSGLTLMFLVFFNIKSVIPIARRIPLLYYAKRFVKDIRVLENFNRRELADVLCWAAIRYLIYCTQYFFLLKFFGIETDIMTAYAGIAAIFLLQTSIPLPPMLGLIARGNLAVQVWSQTGASELGALAATFALWIINLILPALVGTFSLLRLNISKTLGYEND